MKKKLKDIDTVGLMNFSIITGIAISGIYTVGYFIRSLKK